MGELINLTAADGFVVRPMLHKPEGKPRGGVVVVQEIFGVNSHIRAVTDRFASRATLRWRPPPLSASSPASKWVTAKKT